MYFATTDALLAKKEALPESADPFLGKVGSFAGELGAGEKNLPICEESFSGNDVYVSAGSFGKGSASTFPDDLDLKLDFGPGFLPNVYPHRAPNVAIQDATRMVRKIAASYSGCLRLVDIVGAIGIVETMEVKPKVQAKKARASSEVATLREVRAAPEAYPDLDLDRIKERVAELSAASSDSEAVSMVFRRSVQIVVHSDE